MSKGSVSTSGGGPIFYPSGALYVASKVALWGIGSRIERFMYESTMAKDDGSVPLAKSGNSVSKSSLFGIDSPWCTGAQVM